MKEVLLSDVSTGVSVEISFDDHRVAWDGVLGLFWGDWELGVRVWGRGVMTLHGLDASA